MKNPENYLRVLFYEFSGTNPMTDPCDESGKYFEIHYLLQIQNVYNKYMLLNHRWYRMQREGIR